MDTRESDKILFIRRVVCNNDDGYLIRKLDRAVANPNLDLFTVTGKANLLIKLFHDKNLADAQRELEQYRHFGQLPFVPKLVSVHLATEQSFVAYEWIHGDNGYDFLRSPKGKIMSNRERLVQSTMDQILSMGNSIDPGYYAYLRTKGTRFSISLPLCKGLLSPGEEQRFIEDYHPFSNKIERMCSAFPGLYTDRNPGNIIVPYDGDRIYQVDFGLAEATTPIFDLTKLLRTNTGEPSIRDLDQAKIPDYYETLVEESGAIWQFYDLFTKGSIYPWTGSRDEFMRCFLCAALQDHIFYLTKAESLLRNEAPNQAIQLLRKHYHQKMLEAVHDRLNATERNAKELQPWVKKFTSW